MEPWQRIGTYAAGLALDDAGVKGNAELLARMDMIVAAGGGERDEAVDAAILSGLPKAERPEAFLNERLMSDLRPTLFLAQLSNLLAGNISIVHGVTGSSRTFMGEEAAGVDAVRVAHARIGAGQSRDRSGWRRLQRRAPRSRPAQRYGQRALARASPRACGSARRMAAAWRSVRSAHSWCWRKDTRGGARRKTARAAARGALRAGATPEAGRSRPSSTGCGPRSRRAAVRSQSISGTTGCEPATAEERAFLASHPDIAVRATGAHLGHGIEPQFAMNVALAAIALSEGRLFPSFDSSGFERAMDGRSAGSWSPASAIGAAKDLLSLEAVRDGG